MEFEGNFTPCACHRDVKSIIMALLKNNPVLAHFMSVFVLLPSANVHFPRTSHMSWQVHDQKNQSVLNI
jgi:hypothetical protein